MDVNCKDSDSGKLGIMVGDDLNVMAWMRDPRDPDGCGPDGSTGDGIFSNAIFYTVE